MKVAVTGASGRLGRVLLRRLAGDPGIERIVAIDRSAPATPHPGVEAVQADVRDSEIGDALAGCDALVHLAFIVVSGSRDSEQVDSINIGGTQNVVEAARRAGVAQVVYASSIAAYGFHPENNTHTLREDAPCRGNPDFYYARTKAQVEQWLDGFESAHPELAIARLRPSTFLGPEGARNLRVFRAPLFPYLVGPDLPVHVTHEVDVAEAFALALHRRAHGAFNVATDDPLPARRWPEAMGKRPLPIPAAAMGLAELAYRARMIDVDPVWLKLSRQFPIVVSSDKIRRELSWRPRYQTTGAVLRALAGSPTRAASRGTRLFLGSLARLTRLRGGLPLGAREAGELRGIDGEVNLVLTGERPSEWNLSVGEGAVGIHPGLAAGAKATVTMAEEIFFDLLRGDVTYSNATMTGKMRFRGEGGYGLLVGGLISGFRRALSAQGRRGLPHRAFARLVLELGPRPTKARTSQEQRR